MPVKKKSFEENMQRLQGIVQELEQNQKPLDETIELFEEGLELVKTCNTTLKSFENRVDEIVQKNGGGTDEL